MKKNTAQFIDALVHRAVLGAASLLCQCVFLVEASMAVSLSTVHSTFLCFYPLDVDVQQKIRFKFHRQGLYGGMHQYLFLCSSKGVPEKRETPWYVSIIWAM